MLSFLLLAGVAVLLPFPHTPSNLSNANPSRIVPTSTIHQTHRRGSHQLSLSLSLGPSNGCHGPSILLVTIVRKSFGGSPELIEVQGRKILLPRAKGDLQARKSWYPAAWIPSCPRLSWYLLLGAFPPRARARARALHRAARL